MLFAAAITKNQSLEIEEKSKTDLKTEAPAQTIINQEKFFKVKRVIDGDTFELENGQKVRLIGIDTKEFGSKDECFARKAYLKIKELIEGKEVRLEKDVSETDKYGRLLRYVFLDNIFINELLVREGFAQVATYPPDIKYQEKFLEAQRLAKEGSKGLWEEKCEQ